VDKLFDQVKEQAKTLKDVCEASQAEASEFHLQPLLQTSDQSLKQNEEMTGEFVKANYNDEGSNLITHANTTGKKRHRSSSGLDDNAAVQGEVVKRFCLGEISKAYDDLSDSFRGETAKPTIGQPKMIKPATSHPQVGELDEGT
jgi:hypothetical protein